MTLLFDDNEVREVYVSHTKVTLPYNKSDYELVMVYGLSNISFMPLAICESHTSIFLLNDLLASIIFIVINFLSIFSLSIPTYPK